MNKVNPIRVLHIVTSMNMGGLENRIMDIYRNIDRTKVQFDFLVHRIEEGIFDKEIQSLGGKIYRLKPITPKSLLGDYQLELKKFFREHHYNVIHAHNNALSMIPLKIVKKEGKSICIAHSRTSGLKKELKSIVKIYCKMHIKKYADYYFACSNDAGAWLFGKKTLLKNKIRVINNAIECEKYVYKEDIRKKIRSELEIKSNEFVIGHVGSMRYEKNHKFLIDIFEKVKQKEPNAVLLLIGDGDLRDEIIGDLKDKQLYDYTRIIGISKEVNKYMQAMDVFVFPSHFEGFGTVVVEAQAAGLPTIASDTVPTSTNVAKLGKYISLDKSSSFWANEILKCRLVKRNDTSEYIKNAGFDIKILSQELQEFYIKVHEEII